MVLAPHTPTLRAQSGLISRAQLLRHGAGPHDLRRWLRRRDLTPVHPGVYVDHTGPLTWLQEAWAAVLLYWPAALSHESALRAADGPGRRTDGGPLHVAVDHTRRPGPRPAGVSVHRFVGLDRRVLWNLGPPRVRIEEAVLDVAAVAPDDLAAIATVATAVQSRRTTAARIGAALEDRSRIARRSFLDGVLHDVAEGTCSVLEHGYLHRVERAHGLPGARRQLRDSVHGPVFRDVVYEDQGLVVELDGRQFHTSFEDRDADLDRDLDAALIGKDTIRLGWGQVYGRPCRTAACVGRLLESRGWTGEVGSCPDCRGEPAAEMPRRPPGVLVPPGDTRSPGSSPDTPLPGLGRAV